jgi:signal transduction histidine kinase
MAIVIAALVAVDVITILVLSAQLFGTVDANVALEMRAFQQRVAGSADSSQLERAARDFIGTDPGSASGLAPVIRVRVTGGSTLASTTNPVLLQMLAKPANAGVITTVTGARGDYRVAAAGISIHGKPVGDVRIALPLRDAQSLLSTLVPLIVLLSLVVAVAAGGAAFLIAERALEPMALMTATAADITEQDLSPRIDHKGPADEVGRLARNFDAMLERLEAGFQRREEVYAVASHELRTPLTIIRGHLQVLRRQSNPNPQEVNEAIDVALEELERMTAEVNDLLFLGRMLVGRPTALPVDLRQLLLDVQRRAGGAGPQHWVIEARAKAIVNGNGEQLSRALLNLVVNAIRHTPADGEIRLRCETMWPLAIVTVADSGEGISAEDVSHVFEPWYRGGHRSSEGGLGLTVVQQVVQAHGGEVRVESRPGAGTRFTIELPLAEPIP